jgi:hypothetical protein
MKIEKIIEYLEANEKHRPIAQKHKIIRYYITQLHPRLLHVGSDATLEAMIADCLDIDRKIRRAKQLHPHLAGDKEEEKEELEAKAMEDLGYTITP